MTIRNIPKLTVALGFLLLILAYMLPPESLESVLGSALRPLGLVTIFINPVLGLIGSGVSLFQKQWLYLVLNIVILASFILLMSVGSVFQ